MATSHRLVLSRHSSESSVIALVQRPLNATVPTLPPLQAISQDAKKLLRLYKQHNVDLLKGKQKNIEENRKEKQHMDGWKYSMEQWQKKFRQGVVQWHQ